MNTFMMEMILSGEATAKLYIPPGTNTTEPTAQTYPAISRYFNRNNAVNRRYAHISNIVHVKQGISMVFRLSLIKSSFKKTFNE